MSKQKTTSTRVPPFIIDRKSTVNFPDQMADGLRQAIVSGYYRPGERLPTVREFAKLLNVSIRAPLEAVRRLREENLLTSHPRHGITVVAKGDHVYKGHVVFVSPDSEGRYYVNVMAGSLRESLAKAGYLYTRVVVERDENGKYDFKVLDLALRQAVDLVVAICLRPDILGHIAKKGVPFAVISPTPFAADNCVGHIKLDFNAAVPDFANRCLAAGIRSVLQVRTSDKKTDAIPALAKAGITAKELVIPYPFIPGNLAETCIRTALAVFEKKLSKGTDWLPDLIFVTDCYQARGVLLALAHHGVRIPEDVKFVTLTNIGIGPIFWESLSRMEENPYTDGKIVAKYVLSYVQGHGLPDDAVIAPHFVDGDTFPT